MKRTDETRFSPDLTMTRTMQTTNLWRWKSSPKVYENSFTDVAKIYGIPMRYHGPL